jgi:uncharacterized protein with von Willebrand factor type A (vWA) domain
MSAGSSPADAGGDIFLNFFYALREHHVPASTHNWLALLRALSQDLHDNSLDGFYEVARCVLVQSETHYDAFDMAFAQTFHGVVTDLSALLKNLDEWLKDPKKLEYLDPQLKAAIEALGIDELRRQLMERLQEQEKRHEGGNRMVGTGGTSPFGQGGFNPAGVRMGGTGGGRSALAVADARRFRAFRKDLVLDTRQIASALRRLRKLSRDGALDELDLDGTIDQTAKNAGDLEIVMQPPRKNAVRVLLLMDVGGSMDPHARLVSRLFSAAHRGGGFRELKSYYFHNCAYSSVYEDAAFTKPVPISDLFKMTDERWFLVMVGDAWMHPGELMMTSSTFWNYSPGPSGITCLAKLADRFPKSAWLNPEPPRLWDAPTIDEIGRVFPMYPLTLEGLDDMVKGLRRPRAARRRAHIDRLIQAA